MRNSKDIGMTPEQWIFMALGSIVGSIVAVTIGPHGNFFQEVGMVIIGVILLILVAQFI